MAKIENSKIQVSLDNDSKRIIRNLTKAIDRLSRNMLPYNVEGGVTRLMEPAGDPALSDDNENHSPGEKPSFANGGYVSSNTIQEPDKRCCTPENRVELDDNVINALHASVAKYSALG